MVNPEGAVAGIFSVAIAYTIQDLVSLQALLEQVRHVSLRGSREECVAMHCQQYASVWRTTSEEATTLLRNVWEHAQDYANAAAQEYERAQAGEDTTSAARHWLAALLKRCNVSMSVDDFIEQLIAARSPST